MEPPDRTCRFLTWAGPQRVGAFPPSGRVQTLRTAISCATAAAEGRIPIATRRVRKTVSGVRPPRRAAALSSVFVSRSCQATTPPVLRRSCCGGAMRPTGTTTSATVVVGLFPTWRVGLRSGASTAGRSKMGAPVKKVWKVVVVAFRADTRRARAAQTIRDRMSLPLVVRTYARYPDGDGRAGPC